MSYSLQHHGLQHARIPCPSPIPPAYSNSCPSSRWCHPTISSSIIPFSSCLQSFPASVSFQMSQFFISGGQSTEVSALASVLPMNLFYASGGQSIRASASALWMSIQGWFPLGLIHLTSLLSKGISRVFFSNAIRKYQFFSVLPSWWSSHIRTWLLEKP